MSHCCGCYSLLVSLSNGCEEYFLQKRPPWRSVHAATLDYPHSGSQVCHLCYALYGLKQAPRVWFEMFSLVVTQEGFTSSPCDTTLFVRRSSVGITLILLYVDDMIITRNDYTGIHSLQHFLSQHFEMKIWALLAIFLGLRLPHSLMVAIFPKLNMLLIFYPKLVSSMTRLFPLPWNIM